MGHHTLIRARGSFHGTSLLVHALALVAVCLCAGYPPASAQTETVAGLPPAYFWQNEARLQGHLATAYSPDGAFSPDSSTLAVVEQHRVVLLGLAGARIRTALSPQIAGISNLQIQSANFISPDTLFLLATGSMREKGRRAAVNTPELAFQWNIQQNALSGKVDAIGAGGGYLPARYFPQIKYLGLYKNSRFELWSPVTGRGGVISLVQLTHPPGVFTFSPDGHWLLLAQIATNSSPNPVVVLLREHRFVTALPGHNGPVLGMAFSRNSQLVVTACADGNVRVFAVDGWKPVATLQGNHGPVHWAEFSPDGNLVASAGEDTTVHIWNASSGKPVQTLQESHEPLLTIGFSPDGRYLAASAGDNVYVWSRTSE